MTQLARATAHLVDSLPPKKAEALFEYARYLAEQADEEGWDDKFSSPKYRRKLKTLMAQVEREIAGGKTEPLDHRKL